MVGEARLHEPYVCFKSAIFYSVVDRCQVGYNRQGRERVELGKSVGVTVRMELLSIIVLMLFDFRYDCRHFEFCQLRLAVHHLDFLK